MTIPGPDARTEIFVTEWLLQVTITLLVATFMAHWLMKTRPHWAYLLLMLAFIKCLVPPVLNSPVSAFGWVSDVMPSSREGYEAGYGTVGQGTKHGTGSKANEFFRDTVDQDGKLAPAATEGNLPMNKSSELARQRTSVDQPTSFQPDGAREPAAGIRTMSNGVLLLLLIVTLIWLVGVVVVLFVSLRQQRRLSASRRNWNKDERLQRRTERVAERLHMKQSPDVRVSADGIGPGVSGWRRPVIVVPRELCNSPKLDLILAHELLHIRRGDVWHALLQRIALTLWWFHPLVWWASRAFSQVRERCCDDEVMAAKVGRPSDYAHCLVTLLEMKVERSSLHLTLGMRSFEAIQQRLERIMKSSDSATPRTPRWSWLMLILLALVVLPSGSRLIAQDRDHDSDRMKPDDEAPVPTQVATGKTADSGTTSDLQKALVKSLRELGHSVEQDETRPGNPWIAVRLKKTRTACAAIPLMESFTDVESIDAQNMPLRDSDMATLAKLTKLKSLYLNGSEITDAGVRHLAEMTGLERLVLDGTGITDEALRALQTLPKLKMLTMSRTNISDAGVKMLANFSAVETLTLSHTKVTSTGLLPLLEMPALRNLSVSEMFPRGPKKFAGTRLRLDLDEITEESFRGIREFCGDSDLTLNLEGPLITVEGLRSLTDIASVKTIMISFPGGAITDEDCRFLGSLSGLSVLMISPSPGTQISDTGAQEIAKATRLRQLLLPADHFTDEAMRSFGQLTQMEELTLWGRSKITDAGVQYLTELKRLESIGLPSSSQIGDRSAELLGKLPDLRLITLSDTKISDSGLEHLAKLSKLQVISIEGTSVTREGVARLRRRLPEVAIQFENEALLLQSTGNSESPNVVQ